MTSYYLYVVSCSDDTLSTGITTDVARRIEEHNTSKKGAKYTQARRPVFLVYSKRYMSRSKASKEEYVFKKLSREDKLASIQKSMK